MKRKRPKIISKKQVELLIKNPDWTPNPIKPEDWHLLPKFLSNNCTEYIVASGNMNSEICTVMHKISNIIGAFDWIKKEENQKPDEPPYNCYHYVITKRYSGEYVFYGPYQSGMSIPHWADEHELDEYLEKFLK
jgi:hypothetical protein